MTIRIWFQKHTVAGRLPLLDQWYEEHFTAVTRPDTIVGIHTLPEAAYPKAIPEGVVRFGSVETFFSGYFAQQAYAAEQQGYDAFVVGASQDPGLRESRTVSGIPVLGYGEASFHLAAMTGQRFGIVGFIPELAEPLLENINRAGLGHRFSGFQYLPGGAEIVADALRGDTGRFTAAFESAARVAIGQGAQLLLPGEGLPNEILWHLGIHDIDGVPIIDSDGLVVKMAELMVELGRLNVFSRSQAGYWLGRPDPGYLDHLAEVFWK
jgi:allantoin racemase